MTQKSHGPNRRTVLKLLGSSAIAGTVYPSAVSAGNAPSSGYDFVNQKRGSVGDPVSAPEIADARTETFEQYNNALEDTRGGGDGYALLDVENDHQTEIVGYNIVLDEDGVPHEQIFGQKLGGSAENPESRASSTGKSESYEHLHAQADDALSQAVSARQTEDNVTTMSNWAEFDPDDCDSDHCLDEMELVASTNVMYEYEAEVISVPDYAGQVHYHNRIYYDEDSERGISYTALRLEPGWYLCEDHDRDEFCANGPGAESGEVEFEHDWNQNGNNYSGDGIVEGLQPSAGDTENGDVQDTTSVNLGVSSGSGVTGSVGWSRSYSFPESQIVDITDFGTGDKVHHRWEIESDTNSAQLPAENESIAAVQFDSWCTDPITGTRDICQLNYDIEMEWNPGTDEFDESFTYEYYCPCPDPPCPE